MKPSDLSTLPPGVPEALEEEGVAELYPPQAAAAEAGVANGESVVASVPTASGKTLIAELAMLSAVQRGGKALYIVPLRALASEKKTEFERWEEYGIDVGVSTGNYESDGEWLASRDIIVATSEKVDSLVRNGAAWVDDLTCVVADEVHLVDDSHRGPTLEVTLAKLRRVNPGLQVVALSATVGNADEVADWLDAELVESDWRPIDLKMGVHYGNAVNFDDGSQREVPVEKGEKQTEALVADALDERVDGQGGSSLVFVNSRRNAEGAAKRMADVTSRRITQGEKADLRELAEEIRGVSDADTSDDLARCVAKGAAFHHAGLCVTGDTQILRPDGTFDDIRSLVRGSADPGNAIGMNDFELGPVGITDTFEMGERPVLTVRTRTGNELRLSEAHPLPVLGEDGVEWVPAGELDEGRYVARPRQIKTNVEEAPSFRALVPGDHRVFREYETVDRLAGALAEHDLPSTFYGGHTRNRNITVGDFRVLCARNGESASNLFRQAISDGGQKPVGLPKQVNEDICWLAGAVAGDGYVDEHGVTLTGRSKLLTEFDRIVNNQFERSTSNGVSPSGTPYVRLNSKLVADVFTEYFGIPRGEAEIRLPEIGLPDEEFGAFVSGLFDADGSVSPRANTEGSPCVEFYSTSSTVITQLKTALLRFGIVAFRDERDVKGRMTGHAGREINSLCNIHRITIYGTEQLRTFEEKVGFRHSGKTAKLRTAIGRNPDGGRAQNDVIPPSIGERVRDVRQRQGLSMANLEPEVSKATLSRFERGLTPMKRSTFKSLVSQLDEEVLNEVGESDVFWDRIESIERSGSEPLYDLSTTSANFVANGVIAHNTSEHRSLVEDAFRNRLVKCICATPTLAAGVNTPARRVVVRDWKRYDGEFGGMAPLDVLEVHQMMGRAGRPGLDPYGEAVLLAKDRDTMDELFERYVWAEPEPVRSKLAAEPALRTHVLATVASGFATSREGLLDFLDRTLYASQTDDDARLAEVTDRVLEYLEVNDFLGREGGALTATNVGHTVSRLYLDPMSAAEIADGLEAAEEGRGSLRTSPAGRRSVGTGAEEEAAADPEAGGEPEEATFVTGSELADAAADEENVETEITPLGLYHLVSRTPDMYQLYLKSGDKETYREEFYEREEEFLGDAPSEFEDVAFEEWLSALKTARLLEDWASELDEDHITERYGVGPGDIRGKVETTEWLLGAAERLSTELGLDSTVAVREAKKRVEYGVGEELLDLAGVRSIGRKRARRLYESGIQSRTDLREADKSVVLGALRGRRKTAERVLENVGRKDPSMDGVQKDASASATATAAVEGDGSSESATNADEVGDGDGQATFGDFS